MQKVRCFLIKRSWIPRTGALAVIGGVAYKLYHSKNEALRGGMSGMLGALLVELACHPVDTINMRTKADHANNSLKYVESVIRKEGVRSLFRGFGCVYYGYPTFLFGYYLLYKWIKEKLRLWTFNTSKLSETTACTIAAFASEFVFVACVYPFELFKTRTQVPALEGGNHSHVLANLNKEGVLKCYVGFVPHLSTYTCFVGIQFGLYNFIVNQYRMKQKSELLVPPMRVIILASVISGGLASIISNPLETITVMKQTGKNIQFDMLYKKEIWCRGLLPRLAYNIILTTALFFSLEYASALFNVQFSH